jgi:hypothetical protein
MAEVSGADDGGHALNRYNYPPVAKHHCQAVVWFVVVISVFV